LSKRVLAAFLVTLFIVATFATVAEVQAHVTLGWQQPYPGPTTYGSKDPALRYTMPDAHEIGHLAYVLPGSYYILPREQLPNYYSPEGAIITDTQGGLMFYLNVSETGRSEIDITWEDDLWMYIAIPPEFTPPENFENGERSWVATSITNDYGLIDTGKFADDDAFAPGWWYVAISAPTDGLLDHSAQGLLYPAGQDPCPDRQVRTGDFAGCYWVWVGGLTAPSIAGKYFFKFLFDDPLANTEFPPANYPTLVVKGELDPGYISGKVLYGGTYYYGYFYGTPIEKPGRVIAEGEAIDPVTNEPTGRKVTAWAYFNETADGFFEIEGVAPGIYTLTAEAAGFPPVTLATQITVKRGQSIHGINIYVYPGAKIQLKINSKCPTGVVEWPWYVADLSGWPPDAYLVEPTPTWDLTDEEGVSLIPKMAAAALVTAVTNTSFTMYIGDPSSYEGTEVYWDGHVPDKAAHYISGLPAGVYYPRIYVFGYVQLDDYPVVVPSAQYTGLISREMDVFKGGRMSVDVHFHDNELPSAEAPIAYDAVLALEAYDADGVLRAWNTTMVYTGDKNVMDLMLTGDPDVPYGMPPGTYDILVFMEGYAQQEFPKHTIQLCTSGSFSFHLVKGGNITVTVYSRDWQSPAMPLDWLHEPSAIRVYIYNSAGDEIGYVQDNQVAGTDSITFHYWGEAGSLDHDDLGSGLPTDIYTIKAYTVGYIQRAIPEVWVQKASSTGDIPLYLYAGAAIFITVNFKIEELFDVLSDDLSSYYFRINVYDEEGNLAAANITSVPQATDIQPAGVKQWTFEVLGFNGFTTPGIWWGWTPALPWTIPPPEPVETGWVPRGFFGYYEKSNVDDAGYHRDYGIDAGTYTVEVFDETNGYVQTATVAATVSLMGSANIIMDMHKQASISGTVYQRNYMGDFRRASWYTVEVSGSPEITTCTYDGDWGVWVPAGTYTVKVHLMAPDHTEAVVLQERTVVVTWGADAGGQNFYLEEGGIPIPEFPAAGVLMLISALAASLYLLRWRKQAIVPMP